MGGIALGKAVVTSGLLETMDAVIRGLVQGLSTYSVVLALTVVVLVSMNEFTRNLLEPKMVV
jgi:phosphate transporter